MNSVIKLSPTDSRLFSAEIASVLGDINAAVIVQQLHYWMGKEGVGTIIGGVKYIYNSFNDWVKQFPWLSVWQFRKAMTKLRFLGIVKVIRHKSRQWNQTNYYTLDSDRLFQLLNPKNSEARLALAPNGDASFLAQTPETSEMCVSTDRDEDTPQIEVSSSNISYIDTKKTIQKETAKSKEINIERSLSSNRIAAVSIQNALVDNSSGTWESESDDELGDRLLQVLENGAPDTERYDVILIDEAQDFPSSWFSCVLEAMKKRYDGELIIVGDGSQGLYPRGKVSWKQIGINAQGRTIHKKFDLDKNYRNSREILELAASFANSDVNNY